MSKSQRHNIRNIVSDNVNSVVWGQMVATCVVGTYEVSITNQNVVHLKLMYCVSTIFKEALENLPEI